MEKRGWNGSVTVFLSLISILFLGLICTVVESTRVQGAKAQTANITGMGNFSVMGEFEKPLLEDYDIFSVDGSYGNGAFQISKVEEHLKKYLVCNANPKENVFSVWCFDPWNLELTDSRISAYALLTDEKGEPFYQQAVSYMKADAGALAVEKLLDYTKDSEQIKAWGEAYEKRRQENDSQLSELEQEKQQKLDAERQELADKNGQGNSATGEGQNTQETAVVIPEELKHDPLKEIAKLRKKSILAIVTGDAEISSGKWTTAGLPSKSRLRKGTLKAEQKQSGVLADVLFREYLLLHFSNYRNKKQDEIPSYQIEYLLGGKNSDEKNLKYVVNRLLLVREGMNYLYCLENQEMGMQAQGLAVSLTGFLGIPALTAATKHALLLAWAYGESLMDVRILLDGGKVPVFKDTASWKLTLENLGRLTELLKNGSEKGEEGLTYAAYLRILLNLSSLSNQKMRALDLIQLNLQKKKGSETFKAENCIVAIETETNWICKPVFFSLLQTMTFAQKASIGY